MQTKKHGYSNIPVYMINISILVSDCCILLEQSPWRPQKWYFVLCIQVFVAQDNKFCAQEKRNHFSGLQGFPVLAQAPPVMFILWNRVEKQHSLEGKWIYCVGTRQKTGHVWARLHDLSEWPCRLLKMARGQNAPRLLPVAHTINQLLF